MSAPRNPQFNVRIPPELKDRVVALAEKNKRPINAEIVAALEAWTEASLPANPAGILMDLTKRVEILEKAVNKKPT